MIRQNKTTWTSLDDEVCQYLRRNGHDIEIIQFASAVYPGDPVTSDKDRTLRRLIIYAVENAAAFQYILFFHYANSLRSCL